jgi:hypothetical protein
MLRGSEELMTERVSGQKLACQIQTRDIKLIKTCEAYTLLNVRWLLSYSNTQRKYSVVWGVVCTIKLDRMISNPLPIA